MTAVEPVPLAAAAEAPDDGDAPSAARRWSNRYADPAWLVDARFGMFIHWGLYSLAARHEWVMSREKIPREEYERRYLPRFEPDLFDAAEWARAAQRAGMRYAVLTTKHHDGFCLWDSAVTDFTAAASPAGRDFVREFVDAFRQEGLRIGFYHSLLDWHHPSFPFDGLHPEREAAERGDLGSRDVDVYREYLRAQVRELLTGYGTIDYLWFDFSYAAQDWGWARGKGAADWGSQELEKLVLELQPDIILNDRLGLGRGVHTPEQYQPGGVLRDAGAPVVWEACQTLNGSWGYDRDNLNWKSAHAVITMLIDTVSKGGNLLLNVGPDGRGALCDRTLPLLADVEAWIRLHSRSIHGAGPSDHVAPVDCRYTQRGDRLYVHVLAWPHRHLHLPGLAGLVEYAQLLNDASEIPVVVPTSWHQEVYAVPGDLRDVLTLELPVQQPPTAVPVIELFLRAEQPGVREESRA